MKHRIYFLILFSFLFHMGSTAQQNRFLYIQTENKQAFYVMINNTVFSSSTSGYLVIPKLKDGTYQANIGFPKNEWPQQTIGFTITKKDLGFVLKNFGENGWGLFNLQTMEVLMAKNTGIKAINTANNDDDSFTQVLSDVVNTPDLKKKTVLIEPPVAPVIEQPKKEEPVAKVEIDDKEAVKLLFNDKNDKGREMVYTDGNDTIRIFIPLSEGITTVAGNVIPQKTPEKTTEKFIDIELPNPNSKMDSTVKVSLPSNTNKPVVTDKLKTSNTVTMINSDCKANASDEDFLKLRKKMAAEDNDEEMVAVAKKAFRSKCYSTEQVKNLGVLFLNDAGRYQFFDAAYPFVYDTGNFSTLQQQLTDTYFITRFQAMIRR